MVVSHTHLGVYISTVILWRTPANMDSIRKVTDYLIKKGFTRTEIVFREETKDLDANGRPRPDTDVKGPSKYLKAFLHFQKWIENGLDLHKVSH